MSEPHRTAGPHLPRVVSARRTLLWMAVGGGLLLALTGGLLFWSLGGFQPQRPLNAQIWQHPQHTGLDQHDRQAMVRDVQRWLERERPNREQVRAKLGRGDSDSTPELDSYLVGCGFTSFICMDMEALQVHYDHAGYYQNTDFHQF